MEKLLDEYVPVAKWDVSTRQTNAGFIRRTIKPALGHLKVREVRGRVLDKLYARLKRCGDLSCTGRAFTEHRNVPVLMVDPGDPRPAWQQVPVARRGHRRTARRARQLGWARRRVIGECQHHKLSWRQVGAVVGMAMMRCTASTPRAARS